MTSMMLALLCVVSATVAVAQWTCTPIKPGCVCKTPASISCNDLQSIRSDLIEAMDAFPDGSVALGRFKGGIVRLAFHDAAEFSRTAAPFADGSPVFRSDGCVDLAHPGNAGLSSPIAALDTIWAKHCSKISRADFWYYAAKVVIEESTPYIRVGDPSFRIKNFSIPFFAGRVDRTTCETVASTMLPGAEGGHDEIKRTMIDNLGLDVQHTTALLGAHCLGGASPASSGYSGRWGFDPHLFTTQYFQSLLRWGFDKTPMKHATTGEALTQWNINNGTSADPVFTAGIFMLTNDLALMYDMSNAAALPKTCGAPMPDDEFHASLQPGATTPAPSASKCPYLRFKDPSLNFEYWVRRFADGTGANIDGPGAENFLPTFSRAFAYMGQVGYKASDLRCTVCRNANTCSDVSCSTADVQCGTKNQYKPPANGGGVMPLPPITQTTFPPVTPPPPTTSRPPTTTPEPATPEPETPEPEPETPEPEPETPAATPKPRPQTIPKPPCMAPKPPQTLKPPTTTQKPPPATTTKPTYTRAPSKRKPSYSGEPPSRAKPPCHGNHKDSRAV
jgi:hypothetical protein